MRRMIAIGGVSVAAVCMVAAAYFIVHSSSEKARAAQDQPHGGYACAYDVSKCPLASVRAVTPSSERSHASSATPVARTGAGSATHPSSVGTGNAVSPAEGLQHRAATSTKKQSRAATDTEATAAISSTHEDEQNRESTVSGTETPPAVPFPQDDTKSVNDTAVSATSRKPHKPSPIKRAPDSGDVGSTVDALQSVGKERSHVESLIQSIVPLGPIDEHL